jgi:flagellar motor switch protein FliN/FliY
VENNLTQTNGVAPALGMTGAGGNSLLSDLAAEAGGAPAKGDNFAMLMDVGLNLTVELGRTHLTVRQVLDLQKGSVLELDRIAGDAVDIFVNDRLVARGDVVVVDDKFGVRIVELMSPNKDA